MDQITHRRDGRRQFFWFLTMLHTMHSRKGTTEGKKITILRLPPYHPELNAIEFAWAKFKGEVARKNGSYKAAGLNDAILKGFSLMKRLLNLRKVVFVGINSFYLCLCAVTPL